MNPKVKGFHDHIGQEFAAGLGGDGLGLGTISRLEAKAQMLANPYILHMVQVQGRQSGQYGLSLGIQQSIVRHDVNFCNKSGHRYRAIKKEYGK